MRRGFSSVGGAVGRYLDKRWPLADDHDPVTDVFDKACFVLSLDGHEVGHVASVLGKFRTLGRPRTNHDWIWVIAIWSDGTRTPPQENYPPLDRGDVGELLRGEFSWNGITYKATPLPDDERERAWAQLGITERDF